MPLYNQGEEYEENESGPKPRARSRKPLVEEEDVDVETVEEEESAPKKKKKKKEEPVAESTMNPKIIGIVVGLVVLVLMAGSLAIFISGTKKERKDVDASKAATETTVSDDSGPIGGDMPIGSDGPIGGDAPIGEDTPIGGDTPISGSDNSASSQGSTTISASGSVGEFSAKTADTLRKWGFTNSQMEIASRDGISAEAMVEQAKFERKQAQYEAMMEAADEASEAYQKLLNQTWLGQPPMDISGFVDTNTMYSSESHTENVDYEKVEARGMQLWIKCYLENGITAFMPCSPARYNSLPESGNIVVTYTVVTSGGSQVITSINEYKVGN